MKRLRETVKKLIPDPVKNLLRPGVVKYRKLRSSAVRGEGKKRERNRIVVSHGELAQGFPREKKAYLDEGEVIRSALSSQFVGERKRRLCIDVGAHYGSSAASLLADGWKVIGFEPDHENRAILESTLGRYIPDSLVIEEVAVSDKEADEVRFFRSKVSSGISGLSSFHESHVSAGSVATVSLATYAERNSIDRVDFLKIDTEGFDFHVIRGVPWEKWQPDVILCEFEDRKTTTLGYIWTDMADYLVEKGYEVWVSEWHSIVEYGQAHDWNRLFRFPGELEDSEGWGNLLAFRSSVEPAKMATLVCETLQFRGE